MIHAVQQTIITAMKTVWQVCALKPILASGAIIACVNIIAKKI